MAARGSNAKRKDKRRRHAGARKKIAEALAATSSDRPQQTRRPASDKSGR